MVRRCEDARLTILRFLQPRHALPRCSGFATFMVEGLLVEQGER